MRTAVGPSRARVTFKIVLFFLHFQAIQGVIKSTVNVAYLQLIGRPLCLLLLLFIFILCRYNM
jgi:hypothetical protein